MPESNPIPLRLADRLVAAERLTDKHELELHGERGVYEALRDLTEQLKWTNRALWAIASGVIVAALVLMLQGGFA